MPLPFILRPSNSSTSPSPAAASFPAAACFPAPAPFNLPATNILKRLHLQGASPSLPLSGGALPTAPRHFRQAPFALQLRPALACSLSGSARTPARLCLLVRGPRGVAKRHPGVNFADASRRTRRALRLMRRSILLSEAQGGQIAGAGAAALRADDRLQIGAGAIDVVVQHPVLVGAGPLDLAASGFEPLAHRRVVVGPPRAQPPLQLLERGRKDEGAHGLRVLRVNGLPTLHVDVEDGERAEAPRLLDDRAGRAVAVAVHVRVLDERPLGDHAREARVVDEVVVNPVPLLAARRPRRIADREQGPRLLGDQLAREGSLAGP